MMEREAIEIFRQIVAGYFGEGHVFFAESGKAGQVEPYIEMKVTGLKRQVHASKLVDDGGYQKAHREIVARCELNLYTKGRKRAGISAYENTALNDMVMFQNYLDSDFVLEEMDRKGIAVVVITDPRDLSFLTNGGTVYHYRSLLELEVRYIDTSFGGFGQNGYDLPNDSGGGSELMSTDPLVIDDAEIEGGYE